MNQHHRLPRENTLALRPPAVRMRWCHVGRCLLPLERAISHRSETRCRRLPQAERPQALGQPGLAGKDQRQEFFFARLVSPGGGFPSRRSLTQPLRLIVTQSQRLA